MYLKSITLKNFRCFSELEVCFPERLTVIVGNNGAGKTTVLEAATIAAGTLTSAMDGLTNYGIKKNDAHYKYFEIGSVVDVQPQYPVEIKACGFVDEQPADWARVLTSAKSRGGFASAKKITQIADEYQKRLQSGDTTLILPIISYYGTGRLWSQHKEKKNDIFEKNTRNNGYVDSLDGAANDKLMMRWFQKMTIQQFQRLEQIPAYVAVCNAMEKCFCSITKCQDAKIQYNLDTNEIDVLYVDKQNKKVRIPVSQLSDGYKCTISLIADIAYRMAILNPQLLGKVLVETPGIVLIDEVDLHLHPAWQQRILGDLMDIFPKVQFIVSTHAPAVINSVKKESLVVLKEGQGFGASNETYGKDANTILREVMEVSERPLEVKSLFAKFYNAIDEQNYQDAQKKLDKLEKILGDNDSELVECRVRLELELM